MELFLRFTLILLRFLHVLVYPIYWLLSKRRHKNLKPITDKTLLISATVLAEKIRNRNITSEEVITAYIRRIKEVNHAINAIVDDRFEAAIEEAKSVDCYLSTKEIDLDALKREKPLLGVPLTVKESCGLKGLLFTVGSKKRKNFKCEENGEVVSLLINAGAIPLLVSNTPEFCLYWESNNLVTGLTRNAYNRNYSSGASSAGEGALLGAGASLIGIGSDIAGSIRLPAGFNGVFGHKPTSYMTSIKGHFPNSNDDKLNSYLLTGPMVRYAEDLTLLLQIMSGSNSTELGLDDEINLKDVNVYSIKDMEDTISSTPVASEIKNAIDSCVDHLTNSCYTKSVDFNLKIKDSFEIVTSLSFNIANIPHVLERDGTEGNVYLELLKSFFHCSDFSRNVLFFALFQKHNGFIPRSKFDGYQLKLNNVRNYLLKLLGTNGVILCPVFPTPPFQHNEFLFYMSGVKYLSLFNLVGFPCTTVPLGLNKNGLPIAIQVVAAPFQDKLCIAVAKELEKNFGGWVPH